MPFRYPISLELEGRRCMVIGGGEVAEHKARSLLQAGACVKVVAETITDGLLALARRGELTLETRAYSRGDLSGVFLAIAATDDVGTNAAVFEEAEEEKVLINVVDDPSHCHFAVPSVLRRGDFCVAISTGGKAPALSKRARKDLSRQFGPEYGVLVELLGKVREEQISRRSVDFETWAARWQQVLEHGDLVDLVRRGRLREVLETVRAILSGEEDPASPPAGRVMIVGAGPGDPGLITVRGREALAAADVVVYDRLVDPSLVEGKEAIYAGKEPGRHCLPQEKISELLIRLARQGKTVVRLKGGDPFVFGRGAEEAEALAEAGVSFEIVPGLSSAIAAAAYAGIPVTDRRCSSSVAVVTGHCAGSEV
ncbi:MAG: uroporphyrinogen-III C-methyltransferase, partial [Candidatus Methylomirabilales bacterium]